MKINGNVHDLYSLNFKQKLDNMKSLFKAWNKRHLSLKGKIEVINTLALSPLLYISSMMQVPTEVITESKKLILDFLWDGKGAKVKYDVLTQKIQNGGLGLVNYENKVTSLLLGWVKKYIENTGTWQAVPLKLIKEFNKKFGLSRIFPYKHRLL